MGHSLATYGWVWLITGVILIAAGRKRLTITSRTWQAAMDHDDWRVTISFPGKVQAERAKMLFPPRKVADEARHRSAPSRSVPARRARD